MSKTLTALKRVMHCDDDRAAGGGWFITLAKGWAFYDAVPERYRGEGQGCHCAAFDIVAEARERIGRAEPCHCERCTNPHA